MRRFLQAANSNWNFLWKRWLPDFALHPKRGSLYGNKEPEKHWPTYSMTHIIMEPLWIEMLVQGELGRNNVRRRSANASGPSSGSSRAIEYILV